MTRQVNDYAWFAQHYGVPVREGGRVKYHGGYGTYRTGTIVGISGPHLLIRLDGDTEGRPYHPTWRIEYL